MKKPVAKQVQLSSKDADELMQRVKNKDLLDDDVEALLGLISFNAWLQESLLHAETSIKSLKKLFGFTNESSAKVNNNNKILDQAEPSTENEDSLDTKNSDKTKSEKPKWNPEKNHGRTASSKYTGCPTIKVGFKDDILKSGFCPLCSELNTQSKLEYPAPSVLVFLDGGPIVFGQRVQLERAKCLTCETYFKADMPDEFSYRTKYSHTAISTIAIHHYYAGQPFKRIEVLQKAQGIPLADSTQYDLMSCLYEEVVSPVVGALKKCASDGDTLYFDDTAGRVIDQVTHNKRSSHHKDKKSVHATAILSMYHGNKIYLFQTDTQTAGKTFKELIAQRQSPEDFITMSDASANNFSMLEENLLARWVISLCLSHGRRKFYDLINEGDGDDDCRLVLKIIADVYLNERYCKEQKLNASDRLIYHQQHSAPLMDALRIWLNNLILYKQVEPNSRFGEATIYLLKRWQWLTQFLHVEGAPLDNNLCEIAIKVHIRYRNNSRFYKTFYGASIGDAMMSLIHTAMASEVNPFDYLNALQLNADYVNDAPEKWLPWVYQETLRELDGTSS